MAPKESACFLVAPRGTKTGALLGQADKVGHLLQITLLRLVNHGFKRTLLIKPLVQHIIAELIAVFFNLVFNLLGFSHGIAHFHALQVFVAPELLFFVNPVLSPLHVFLLKLARVFLELLLLLILSISFLFDLGFKLLQVLQLLLLLQ